MSVKIHLEHAGNVVAAEGEAEFVKDFIDEWRHLLEVTSEASKPEPALENSPSAKHIATSPKDNQSPDEAYENVFALHNEKLKVIADLPSSSKAETTRVAAQALLYGEYLRGNESVSAESIKAVCLDHGCYDSKNFASHLKSLKSKVVMDPKPGGDYSVKLTAPGRKAAQELVSQLNDQA